MYKDVLRQRLSELEIPRNELIVLHVRLKNLLTPSLDGDEVLPIDYRSLSQDLLDVLSEQYQPSGLLVPSFTYSFTKTGIFDRKATPGEVGRFGEEVRKLLPASKRLLEPVFSMIDCSQVFGEDSFDPTSAFGNQSLWDVLSFRGFVCLNLNVPELFGTYLHYLECKHNVPYRFSKSFSGAISMDGMNWERITYEYNVRRLDIDTSWRRHKLAQLLNSECVLHEFGTPQSPVRWFHSAEVDLVLGQVLDRDPLFLIND